MKKGEFPDSLDPFVTCTCSSPAVRRSPETQPLLTFREDNLSSPLGSVENTTGNTDKRWNPFFGFCAVFMQHDAKEEALPSSFGSSMFLISAEVPSVMKLRSEASRSDHRRARPGRGKPLLLSLARARQWFDPSPDIKFATKLDLLVVKESDGKSLVLDIHST